MTVSREEIETLRLLRAFAKIKERAKRRAIVDLVEGPMRPLPGRIRTAREYILAAFAFRAQRIPVRVKISASNNRRSQILSRFEDLGAVPKGSTPAELAAFLQSEIDKWDL